jgi:hypothetical protein
MVALCLVGCADLIGFGLVGFGLVGFGLVGFGLVGFDLAGVSFARFARQVQEARAVSGKHCVFDARLPLKSCLLESI